MATFIDADRAADNTGTPISSLALPSMTAQSGDWFIAHAKWEGTTTTVTATADVGTSNTGATTATQHTGTNDHHSRMFYGQITSGSAAVLTVNFSASRPYVVWHGYIFRPAGGQILVFDTAATPTQGSSDDPATGSTANAAAGAAVCGVAIYSSKAPIPGTGWTEVLSTTESGYSEYRLLTGAGNIVGDCDFDADPGEWIAQMVILKEQAEAGPSGQFLSIEPMRRYRKSGRFM